LSTIDWFGDEGDVSTNALVLFAPNRIDSMYLRFRLLSALIKAPLRSKTMALRLLHISRQYLGRILREWKSLGMIDVRDMSPYDNLRPVMAIYLVKRPVISITRLNNDVEDVKDVPSLKEIVPAIASETRRAILTILLKEEKKRSDGRAATMTVKELQEKLGGVDIHRHVRILLKARLLLKLRTPEANWWRRGGRVAVMRNYKNIRFSLQPHTY
jgi:DNA-binding transcriptional ArsR family regulator